MFEDGISHINSLKELCEQPEDIVAASYSYAHEVTTNIIGECISLYLGKSLYTEKIKHLIGIEDWFPVEKFRTCAGMGDRLFYKHKKSFDIYDQVFT